MAKKTKKRKARKAVVVASPVSSTAQDKQFRFEDELRSAATSLARGMSVREREAFLNNTERFRANQLKELLAGKKKGKK